MRLLVVEDEPHIATFLKSSLEAESYAVDVAECGEKGSRYARVNDYDLVILDHALPNKDGLVVCREIREYGKTMPILMLSCKSEVAYRVSHLDAGADDYLPKPFALSELTARIRALLRRNCDLRPALLKAGRLTLDTRSGIAKNDTQILTLTRKEYMLLEYFMQNAGAILSRGMIMEHVWDINADLFSNTIETHVLSLRRKLGDHDRACIQTISGRGYRMTA